MKMDDLKVGTLYSIRRKAKIKNFDKENGQVGVVLSTKARRLPGTEETGVPMAVLSSTILDEHGKFVDLAAPKRFSEDGARVEDTKGNTWTMAIISPTMIRQTWAQFVADFKGEFDRIRKAHEARDAKRQLQLDMGKSVDSMLRPYGINREQLRYYSSYSGKWELDGDKRIYIEDDTPTVSVTLSFEQLKTICERSPRTRPPGTPGGRKAPKKTTSRK